VAGEIRFCKLLPTAQCGLALVFGGFGVWQRSAILNQRFIGNQTLWNTTARFHVWPWPYKFAAILNMPAFICGMFLSWPLEVLSPNLPEIVQMVPSLVLVLPLWFWVGARLDRRFSQPDGFPMRKLSWAFLVAFVLICLGGAMTPLGYVGYLPYGVVVWIAAGLSLWRLTRVNLRKLPTS
jgi:hypothetical protein